MLVTVKILKLLERKNAWKEIKPLHWGKMLYQHKQGIILSELALWNRPDVYETGKKRKSFLFEATIPSLLVTANFSKRKWKTYQVEIQSESKEPRNSKF